MTIDKFIISKFLIKRFYNKKKPDTRSQIHLRGPTVDPDRPKRIHKKFHQNQTDRKNIIGLLSCNGWYIAFFIELKCILIEVVK